MTDTRLSGLPIKYLATQRHATSMIVLMPSALAPQREDRERVIFHRSNWASEWPSSEVLAFADPALQQDSRLNGAWFIHPEHDLIETLAEIVKEHASAMYISPKDVIVYGASQGGFGALGVASIIGARAVAEVPQIDFELWQDGAIDDVEKYILGRSITSFRQEKPEQVSVLHRFQKSGQIPELEIITNLGDCQWKEHLSFIRWINNSKLPKLGNCQLSIRTDLFGHSILPRDTLAPYLQEIIKRGSIAHRGHLGF